MTWFVLSLLCQLWQTAERRTTKWMRTPPGVVPELHGRLSVRHHIFDIVTITLRRACARCRHRRLLVRPLSACWAENSSRRLVAERL